MMKLFHYFNFPKDIIALGLCDLNELSCINTIILLVDDFVDNSKFSSTK